MTAAAWVLRPHERESFKRCRRAWDLGARERQNLEPVRPQPEGGWREAVRAALAVYYFPGMWSWSREIVRPLALAAFEKALRESPEASGPCDSDRSDRPRPAAASSRATSTGPATHDRFVPIRVEAEFEVGIPDPHHAGLDVVASDGRPILYRETIDMLVEDEAGACWILARSVGADGWAPRHRLQLDERGTTRCWAWELFFLGMTVAGVVYDELREPAQFRRTPIARSRAELERSRRLLAEEALEMTRSGLAVYPQPSAPNCDPCPYRDPCLALTRGDDDGASALLRDGFRTREPERVREGAMGKVSWSVGRGARPNRFGATDSA